MQRDGNMSETANGEVQRVDELLESTLESVDHAEAVAVKAAEDMGFDEEELHKIGIAVRESMVNAVVHGNRYNARKKVHFEVRRTETMLTIRIGDEGDGFERKAVADPLAEENLLKFSGRGLLLIEAFMDEFKTEPRAPRGTQVTLVKRKPTVS
jgi:serine/threonine-protein kinase RsbW